MTSQKLEPFGNVKADLFYWLKEYLGSKMSSLEIDDGFAITFNRAANKERIVACKDVAELDEVTREIRREGMKNLGIYSVATLAFYRYVLTKKKIESIKEIDTSFRDEYITKNPNGLKPGTLKSYLFQINSLFKYVEENSEDEHRFHLGRTRGGRKTVSPIQEDDREMEYLEPDELKRFLEALETYKYQHDNPAQVRLMMKIACYAGLRVDELLSLKASNLSFVSDPSPLLESVKYMRIDLIGKGKKPRTAYIKASLIQKDYDEHMKHRKCGMDFLFCNQNGAKYNSGAPYDQLTRILRSIGIDKTGMHILRRSYATYLMAQNVDFAIISELLGHNDEEVTELYVRFTKDGLRKIVKYWGDI
ncbi:hypothetical protein E0765_04720 [Sulfuricurvum sp. IAE1]|uniref:tyrosine-type recombinase/integrase n=1 Tax=Sulfuricurvum sp. IAE1 TaxID=2546102 RepID=UPI00104A6E0F|nr:tyrosine-type recombinase/integrase [Sulfuricurvum sp. IAE1]TDA65788.1 hypothetical protein E0765_04720 [Sulfuricurvum sp. IAE1]